MSTYRERYTQPGRCRGARVILVEALPVAMPGMLVASIVAACAYDLVSLEWMLLSASAHGGSVGTLQPMLVLRAEADGPEALKKRLDDFAARMLDMFTRSGFAAHVAAPDEDEQLTRRLSGAANQAPRLFYAPPYQAEGCYAPVRLCEAEPMAMVELAAEMTRCPGVLVSFTLQCAAMQGPEAQLIEESVGYFNHPATPRNEHTARCASAFAALAELRSQRLFFTVPTVRCEGEIPRSLMALLVRHGLRCSAAARASAAVDDLLCDGGMDAVMEAQRLCPPETAILAISMEMRKLAFLATPDEAARCFALPQKSQLLQGVRVHAALMDHQPIADALTDPSGIPLGVRYENDTAVYMPAQQLATHASIVGMPGMGKTTAAIGLLHALQRQGIPFLVVEPAKTEYRALIDAVPDLRIYTPGRTDVSPMGLNPFLPPRGITLEQYLPSLTTAFTAAFSMTRPLNVIFPDVLRSCYTRYGWRANSTRDSAGVTHFGLMEFISVFRESIEKSGYDPESKANLQSGGVYRLMSLINSDPALYDTDNTLPFDTLLEQPTLIELDAVDNVEQKSLLMTLILLNLSLVVRQKQAADGRIKNVVMIDEAHVLLGAKGHGGEGDADPAAMAVSLLQNMVMIFRAYGTGLIFADQSPEKLTRSIVENTNVRIAMHLDSEQDRALLSSAMGLNGGMSAVMRQLQPGQAYLGCRLLERPIRIKLPDSGKELGLRHDVSDREIAAHMMQGGMPRPFMACGECAKCQGGCDHLCRMEADFLARTLCDRLGEKINDKKTVVSFAHNLLERVVKAAVQELSAGFADKERLRACTVVQFKRRLLLLGPVGLTMSDLED